MTKRQLQIKANKDFISRVQAKFSEWCSKKGKHPTQDNFVSYLIRHNFIDETIINRFLCLEYYKEELPPTVNEKRKKGVKTLAIWSIEDRLPLKERQINANLINHACYFKDNIRKMP
jgi:hypothetical protein